LTIRERAASITPRVARDAATVRDVQNPATMRSFLASLTASLILVSLAPRVAAASPERDQKSPALATTLAIAPVAIGMGLTIAGGLHDSPEAVGGGLAVLAVGPSAGHFYTGDLGRGLAASGVRTVGGLAATLGAYLVLDNLCIDERSCDQDDLKGTGGAALVIAGGVAVVGATVYDIIDAGRSARRHNARIAVTPTVLPGASGPQVGLAVGGAF
jgi:hypothetical protein